MSTTQKVHIRDTAGRVIYNRLLATAGENGVVRLWAMPLAKLAKE